MTDIFHDAYVSVVIERERLKTQLAALAADYERRTEQLNQSMAMTDSCIENINRLIAENERLRSASFVTAVPSEEYERLKAENERLRKAGDAIMEVLESEIPFTAMNAVNGWLAAKEGGAK